MNLLATIVFNIFSIQVYHVYNAHICEGNNLKKITLKSLGNLLIIIYQLTKFEASDILVWIYLDHTFSMSKSAKGNNFNTCLTFLKFTW